MFVNKMHFLGLFSKIVFRFPIWFKPVAGIVITGGFDANILGLILIFDLFGGISKVVLSVITTRDSICPLLPCHSRAGGKPESGLLKQYVSIPSIEASK
jgi:hypothetical protein